MMWAPRSSSSTLRGSSVSTANRNKRNQRAAWHRISSVLTALRRNLTDSRSSAILQRRSVSEREKQRRESPHHPIVRDYKAPHSLRKLPLQ